MMRTLLAFFVALFASLLVGGMAVFQLGIAFRADLELLGVLFAVMAVTAVALAAFAAAYATSQGEAALARTAVGLVFAVLLLAAGAVAYGAYEARDVRAALRDAPVLIEFAVPCLLAVLVQWWIVRRRWRKAHGG